jgi:hypothetical protein
MIPWGLLGHDSDNKAVQYSLSYISIGQEKDKCNQWFSSIIFVGKSMVCVAEDLRWS